MNFRKTNIEIMKEKGQTWSSINRMRRQQAAFIGHVMTMEGLEHLITTGKQEGKGAKGDRENKRWTVLLHG